MKQSFKIEKYIIGKDGKPFIIAEIAQNHDGSLGMAHAYIDAVADAGADAVKFQTHIASEESTLDEPFRVQFSRQDTTRYAYWKRTEFTSEQWRGLAEHARERNLVFLSSAFSIAAVKMLNDIGMPAWKVGSGEVFNNELLKAMAQNNAPILLSTGMSSYCETEKCVAFVKGLGLPYALLQCTSAYPVPLNQIGLNVIDELKKRFDCPVGLSDHSGSIFPGLALLARGVDLLEVHVTFDRRMFGPDISVSITTNELKLLVDARDAFCTIDANPVDKDAIAKELMGTRDLFTKSLSPKKTLEIGTVLQEKMLTLKKPGTGISKEEITKVVGRRLVSRVTSDRLLQWEDIDEKA